MNDVAQRGQYGVPHASAQSGEEQKTPHVHASQTGRNADKLSYGRYQTAKESGRGAMLAEESLGMFNLGTVDKAHVAQSAVGKAVHYGASQPLGQIIVDEGTHIGTQRGYHYHHNDVEVAVVHHGKKCRGGHYHLGGKWYERTLDSHEHKHPPVVEVVQYKVNKELHVCLISVIKSVSKYKWIVARVRS